MQKGQDLVVAHFCADRGIGHLFHQNGLTALVLGEGDDAPLAQLGVYQVLARLRATVAVNEEEVCMSLRMRCRLNSFARKQSDGWLRDRRRRRGRWEERCCRGRCWG